MVFLHIKAHIYLVIVMIGMNSAQKLSIYRLIIFTHLMLSCMQARKTSFPAKKKSCKVQRIAATVMCCGIYFKL